jgi:large subunit ribosomal protein L6e
MVKSKDQIKQTNKNRRLKNKEDNTKLKLSRNWYPTTDKKEHFKRALKVCKKTKLRKDCVAGQVLIILSGRFRGRRVVFLKQLSSGLLLVTGPYKLTGGPLKRVNQAYCIATKTNVNIGSIKHLESVDDAFFAKKTEVNHDNKVDFFEAPEAKKVS